MSPRSRSPRWLYLIGAAALPLLVLVGWLLLRLRDEVQLMRASAELDRRIAAYEASEWRRPVLRGEPIEGNAQEAQHDAVRLLGTLDAKVFEDFSHRLLSDQGPSAAVLALVPPNAEKLRAIRAAAQRSQARTRVDLERWYETSAPPYGHLLMAWELLFAQATQESPGECLRIITDVIRLSQDAGTGVIGHVTATYVPRMAPLVAVPCALKATPAERAAAERELEALITQGPSMAEALELERLALSVRLRRAIASHAASPTLTKGPWGERFDRSNAIAALHTLMSMKPHGSPGRDPYPALLASAKREAEQLGDSSNPMLVLDGSDLQYVDVDGKAQASLRALAVAMAAMPDGPGSPALETALKTSIYRDPFTGLPLRTDTDKTTGTWRVLSFGANGRPDPGPEGDDVIVAVPK